MIRSMIFLAALLAATPALAGFTFKNGIVVYEAAVAAPLPDYVYDMDDAEYARWATEQNETERQRCLKPARATETEPSLIRQASYARAAEGIRIETC